MIRLDDIEFISFMASDFLLKEHVFFNNEILVLQDIIAEKEMTKDNDGDIIRLNKGVNKSFYERLSTLKTIFNAIDLELTKRERDAKK